MLFTRRHEYDFSIPKEHLRYHLIGDRIHIDGLDFRVMEDEQHFSILPEPEDRVTARSFPLTEMQLESEGNRTKVVITSRLRKVDTGLPLVLMMFCVFLLIGSAVLLYIGHEPEATVTLWVLTLALLTLLIVRLQQSYFGYVRRIHSHIKHSGDRITQDVRRQLFKHKAK
jgi:hypothetical protein